MKKWFFGLLAFLFSLTAQSQTTYPATNTLSIVSEEQFGKIMPNQSNLYLIYSSSGWSIWKMRPNDLSSPASTNIRVHPTLKIRFERIPLQGTISGGSSGGVNNISLSQISDLANIYPPKWTDVTQKPDMISNLAIYLGAPYRTFQSARLNTQTDISAFYITNAYQQGLYVLKPGDTTTPDDTTLIFKDALNRRFERVLPERHYNIAYFGAIPNDNVDDTYQIQRAVDKAFSNGISTVKVPNGSYKVTGTVYLKPGVKLVGETGVGEYYNEYDMSKGAMLLKDAGGAVPLVQMASQSVLEGLYIKSTAAGTGTSGMVRFGPMSGETNITQAVVKNCFLFGYHSTNIMGINTCYGIFFPESSNGYARYFNKVEATINHCDVGVRLSGQSNGNEINVHTLNNYLHIETNGGSTECIENKFHVQAFNTTAFSPVAIVMKMTNQSKSNQIYLVSEIYGKAYEIDHTSGNNDFYAKTNEAYPSFVGTHNTDHTYARPINIQQYEATYLPSRTSGDRYIIGRGAKASYYKEVTGPLAQLDNNVGTPTANDADSKIITRFNPHFFRKSQRPSFRMRYRVYANIPYSAGYQFVEVELLYLVNNTATGEATLSVLNSNKKGAQITGLHFIKSTSSPEKGFAVAITGGFYGAYAINRLVVSIEVESIAFDFDEKFYNQFFEASFETESLTSEDVADAINLLSTGDTTI